MNFTLGFITGVVVVFMTAAIASMWSEMKANRAVRDLLNQLENDVESFVTAQKPKRKTTKKGKK